MGDELEGVLTQQNLKPPEDGQMEDRRTAHSAQALKKLYMLGHAKRWILSIEERAQIHIFAQVLLQTLQPRQA